MKPSLEKNSILVVDDEEDICRLIQGILEDEGYVVDYATSFQSAIKSLSETEYGLCLLDVWLHDSSEGGIELMQQSIQLLPFTPVIMMSGHSTVETAVQAIKKGAYDFIEKPFKTDRLLVMVQRAIELSKLKGENQKLKRSKFSESSPVLNSGKFIFEDLKPSLMKAGQSNTPVLISGPVGVGKKSTAKFIHNNSLRQENPFIVFYCADSFEKGIDALIEDNGSIESGRGGTLVLDKVSQLSLGDQKAFLSHIEKSGQSTSNGLDVRFVATSDVDLLEMVEKGAFLKDLYYFLNAFPVVLPTLKDRKHLLPSLIDGFYVELQSNRSPISVLFTEEAIDVLLSYDWPGNVKQLKNFVEWLHIMNFEEIGSISVSDFPQYLLEDRSVNNAEAVEPSSSKVALFDDCMDGSLKEAREKFEKYYLEKQLSDFNYNISKASSYIGMERSALHRKLKSLSISTSSSAAKKVGP